MMKGPVLELQYEADDAAFPKSIETTLGALQDLFRALLEAETRTGVFSPQRLLQIFKSHYDSFQTSQHQDAHEFLGLMLNSIINTVDLHTQQLQDQNSHKLLASAALDGAPASSTHLPLNNNNNNNNNSGGTSWVHGLFEGVLTSETRCLACETASQRDETFLDLSIDLEEHTSVATCLRNFSKEEMLCEMNKFQCDTCGGLQEAEKRMRVKRLPKVLALHLKRFKMTDYYGNSTKLFHRVNYPSELRLFNTADDAGDPDRLYELYAVVIHVGPQAAQGHYVSVVRTKEWGWLLFDDELVEPVDEEYVNRFFGGKDGQPCAYVLFYQETSPETRMAEQRLLEKGGVKAAIPPPPTTTATTTTTTTSLPPPALWVTLPKGLQHMSKLRPNGVRNNNVHMSKSDGNLLSRFESTKEEEDDGPAVLALDLETLPPIPPIPPLTLTPTTPSTPSSSVGSIRAWRRKDQESLSKKLTEKTKSKDRAKSNTAAAERAMANGPPSSTRDDDDGNVQADLKMAKARTTANGVGVDSTRASQDVAAEPMILVPAQNLNFYDSNKHENKQNNNNGPSWSGKRTKSLLGRRSFAFLSGKSAKVEPRPKLSRAAESVLSSSGPRSSGAMGRDGDTAAPDVGKDKSSSSSSRASTSISTSSDADAYSSNTNTNNNTQISSNSRHSNGSGSGNGDGGRNSSGQGKGRDKGKGKENGDGGNDHTEPYKAMDGEKEKEKEKNKEKEWFRFRRKRSFSLLSLSLREEDTGAGAGARSGQ